MYIILVSVVNDRDESKNGVAREESWRGRTETINYDVIIVAGAFRKLPNASAIKTHRVQSEPENCSLTSGSMLAEGPLFLGPTGAPRPLFFPIIIIISLPLSLALLLFYTIFFFTLTSRFHRARVCRFYGFLPSTY